MGYSIVSGRYLVSLTLAAESSKPYQRAKLTVIAHKAYFKTHRQILAVYEKLYLARRPSAVVNGNIEEVLFHS